MSDAVELEAALLIVLAREGVPPDVQELLVRGNPSLGVKPHVLARAALAAAPGRDEAGITPDVIPADERLPIETAPKDGRPLLVWADDSWWIGRWDDDRHNRNPRPYWFRVGAMTTTYCRRVPPTRWMPLPAPPNRDG